MSTSMTAESRGLPCRRGSLTGLMRWKSRKGSSAGLFASTNGAIKKIRREAKMKIIQRKQITGRMKQKFLKDNLS